MDRRKLKVAENAIRDIAQRDGVSIEYVRTQMKIAMMNGLCSADPKAKAFWNNVPSEGQVPTPEELILYMSDYPVMMMLQEIATVS